MCARQIQREDRRVAKRSRWGEKWGTALEITDYSYSPKIFQMCRDVDGLSFLTSAKTGRWGRRRVVRRWEEERKEGKDERSAHDRIESRRSGTEFSRFFWMRIEKSPRRRLLGPALLCRLGPKTSVIRLAVQISYWSRFSPVKNRRWFPCSHPRHRGHVPEKHRSTCPERDNAACVRRAHVILRGRAEGAKRIWKEGSTLHFLAILESITIETLVVLKATRAESRIFY